jgi:tetratricopeptide (TPR) repeat protein
MDIQEFYAHLLELALPWLVKRVISEDGAERVDVYLECLQETQFRCPYCDKHSHAVDYSPSRTWRHLDTCGKATYLHSMLPVVYCSAHGRQQPHPPWGERNSPFTRAFEQLFAQLAENLDDIGKAVRFARVEQAHLRHLLQHKAKETGKVSDRRADGQQTVQQAYPESKTKQPSLFEQTDLNYANRGIQAYRKMELERAVEFLQKHRTLFPKGYDISCRLAVADFLLRGIQEMPAVPSERPGYLCGLWHSFEDYIASEYSGRDSYIAEVKGAFFARVIESLEDCGSIASSFVPGGIPVGYILLQAERYEEAIRSLQQCIPQAPHNPSIYGYLGDAYRLRGDVRIARQCYEEACVIDPAGLDWRHLRDEDVKDLKQDLIFVYGSDPELAVAWFPSHARINGLFERKVVRINDGLKEMADDYLAMEKALAAGESPLLAAKIFFRGMILCENQENLKFIKKIDLIRVRRTMKQANPDLFEEFLGTIMERGGSEGSGRR